MDSTHPADFLDTFNVIRIQLPSVPKYWITQDRLRSDADRQLQTMVVVDEFLDCEENRSAEVKPVLREFSLEVNAYRSRIDLRFH